MNANRKDYFDRLATTAAPRGKLYWAVWVVSGLVATRFSHELFRVYLGVMVWGALWLHDPRIRALLPQLGPLPGL